jgi:hypothetical protein
MGISTAIFVAPGGALIDTPELLANLVDHFEAWRRDHGPGITA